MIYKGMLLSILLLPVASYGKSTELCIKDLKEAQFQKRLEINNIEKMIGECEHFLVNVSNDYHRMLEVVVAIKRNRIIQDGGNSLTAEEVKNLRNSLNDSVVDFEKRLAATFDRHEASKPNIVVELFDGNNPHESESFNSLKFMQMKLFTQTALMKKLLEKYDHYLEELVQLDIEINTLECRN
ncbi:MAG: hypothetical protein P4L31_06325 [Candidatus Babeliales bacterium]|nr:hypothetical protein [Candidatus Babeliales bacterium]